MAGTDYQRVPFLLLQCVTAAGAAAKTPSPHFSPFLSLRSPLFSVPWVVDCSGNNSLFYYSFLGFSWEREVSWPVSLVQFHLFTIKRRVKYIRWVFNLISSNMTKEQHHGLGLCFTRKNRQIRWELCNTGGCHSAHWWSAWNSVTKVGPPNPSTHWAGRSHRRSAGRELHPVLWRGHINKLVDEAIEHSWYHDLHVLVPICFLRNTTQK